MKFIKIFKGFFYGLIFGFTSPIPGVSAGTMAILLNVYEKFFNSINIAAAKKNIFFIISFLLGWVFALFGISNIIMFLFDNHSQIISFSFNGLIIGCIPLIYKKAAVNKIRINNIAVFLAAFVFMLFLAFYGDDLSTNQTLEQLGGMTPFLLGWLFISSLISSMAMLIPGVGGSLMMFVFGIYAVYIEAIATLNPILLIIFIISMIFGVLAGIILTKKMLASYSQSLYFAILGFIIGSLFIIYPGFSLDITGLLSAVFAVFCMILAYRLSKKS